MNLEAPTSHEKLVRELQGDHKYLVNKALKLVDKLATVQGDIVLVKSRLEKLKGGASCRR